jgi:cytochrome c553
MKKIILSSLLACVTLVAADGAPIYKSGILLTPKGDLIYEKKCLHCHGADGKQTSFKGSSKIEYNVIAGRDAGELAQELKDYKGGVKSKNYQPLNKYGYGALMRSSTVDLSWDELDAVAKYVNTLK